MESTEFLLILFVGIQAHFVIGGSPPVIAADSSSKAAYLEADQFLTFYGYYPSSGPSSAPMRNPSLRNHSNTERIKALKLFQKFYNLPQSGKLDKETTQLMQRPRCGNPDITSNLNTMATPAFFEEEDEEDVSETMNEQENQETKDSGVNVDRGRRSPGRFKKWQRKRQEQKKTVIWTGKELKWRLERPKRPDLEDTHIYFAGLAIRYWQPLLNFTFNDTSHFDRSQLWGNPPKLRIYFHEFGRDVPDRLCNYGNWINVKGRDPGLTERLWEERRRRLKREQRRRRLKRELIKRKDPNYSQAHAEKPGRSNQVRYIHLNSKYDWSNDYFYQIMLHEIGHVLGLEHSKQKSSIMYPYNLGVSEFSLSDLRAIRQLYGRRDVTYICDAKFRELRHMFKDDEGGNYFLITGNRVQYMGEGYINHNYRKFKRLFPGVPSNFDLAFPYVNETFIFIVFNGTTPNPGGTIFKVDASRWKRRRLLQSFTFEPGTFEEKPKIAVTIDQNERMGLPIRKWYDTTDNRGGRFTRLFSANFSFDFELKGKTIVRHDYYWNQPSLKDVMKVAKLAVQRGDERIYFLTRNGSYAMVEHWDRYVVWPGKTIKGYPPWIRSMICTGRAVCDSPICYTSRGHSTKGSGMSTPGLMLVIMLSLITRY